MIASRVLIMKFIYAPLTQALWVRAGHVIARHVLLSSFPMSLNSLPRKYQVVVAAK